MSETTKQNWREEQAKAELGHTDISRPLALFMSILFIATICAVPVIQHVVGVKARLATGKAASLACVSSFSGVGSEMAVKWRAAESLLDHFLDPNAVLLKRINEFTSAMDDNCFLTKLSAGPVQEGLCRLGAGNEKAFVGKDGWLFYEPGVKYLTGPAFLDPAQLRKRARGGNEFVEPPQPNPVKGILHFNEQLKKRGIELVVVPVPGKASIYPEKFSRRYGNDGSPLQNESFGSCVAALRKGGVHVFDPSPMLMAAKGTGPQYLKTDTHWRPEAMGMVASRLADHIAGMGLNLPSLAKPEQAHLNSVSVTNLGDIAVMLKLPVDQDLFPDEVVTLFPVVAVDGSESDVLLLGDSFANIYSLPDMGWGESAGLAEHLAAALMRPVESITRNDAGACATREQLALQMLRGDDVLAGKKVVVWEFAARELSVGDWKMIDLVLGEASNTTDALAGQDSAMVKGVVASVSGRPVKGAPYKNFIMKLFVKDMTGENGKSYGDGVVHVYGMRDRKVLPIAGARVGAHLNLELRSWAKVQKRMTKMKTGMFDDMTLEIDQALYWGEIIKQGARIKDPGMHPPTVSHASKQDAEGGEPFWRECGKMVATAGEDAMTVKGRDGWLFLKNELRHISAGKFWGESAGTASRATSDEKKDPLPVILDVKNQLDALGIELILLPVPPKAFANPDKLPAGIELQDGRVPRLDAAHQEFYKVLAEKGVTVLDVFPELSARDGPLMYCKSDSHWSGEACVKVGRLVAERIKKSAWYAGVPKSEFAVKSYEVEIEGDLGGDLAADDPARKERLTLRSVSADGAAVEEDPHSPVLVMADSHGLVFNAGGDMHAVGAGFFDQLAYELRLRPSLIAVRGSGATPTRIALYRQGKGDPEFLSSKKVVVWLFTAREFTETSGWAKLPVTRK
jgi:hypothetical protein